MKEWMKLRLRRNGTTGERIKVGRDEEEEWGKDGMEYECQ